MWIPSCGTPGPAVEFSTQRVALDASVGIPQFAHITKISCGMLSKTCGSWATTTTTSIHGMFCTAVWFRQLLARWFGIQNGHTDLVIFGQSPVTSRAPLPFIRYGVSCHMQENCGPLALTATPDMFYHAVRVNQSLSVMSDEPVALQPINLWSSPSMMTSMHQTARGKTMLDRPFDQWNHTSMSTASDPNGNNLIRIS